MSLFANHKAEDAHFDSLSGFLASLSGMAIALVTGICAFGLLFSFGGRRFLFPRYGFRGSPGHEPASLASLVRICVARPSQHHLHECGLEGFYFLRFLGFLTILFGSLSISLTPGIAILNYFSPTISSNSDALHRLDWSNSTNAGTLRDWLYACLVPTLVAYVLFLLTREIRTSIDLHPDLQENPNKEHFVVISDVPKRLQNEGLLKCYGTRALSLRQVEFLWDPERAVQLVKTLRVLIKAIEERESMVNRRVNNRYLETFKTWLPAKVQLSTYTTAALYQEACLVQSQIAELFSHPSGKGRGGCTAVIRVQDLETALALADRPVLVDKQPVRAHYAGLSLGDVSILARSWHLTQVCRVAIRALITGLALLWTIPISIASTLSHFDYLLTLLLPPDKRPIIPLWLLAVIQGILPGVASAALMWSFSIILRILLDQMRLETVSKLCLTKQKYHFLFVFLQSFVATSISSGCVPAVLDVINRGISELPLRLARSFPLASDYFLSFSLVQAMVFGFLSFSRAKNLAQWYTSGGGTPRQQLQRFSCLLTNIEWGELYSFYGLVAISALAFCLIAPLILATTTVGLLIVNITYRYTLGFTVLNCRDTRALSYFQGLKAILIGVYTFEICSIGQFLLRAGIISPLHSVLQLSLLTVTLFLTTQYHKYLDSTLSPWLQMIVPKAVDDTFPSHSWNAVNPFASEVTWSNVVGAKDAALVLPADDNATQQNLIAFSRIVSLRQ